MNRFVFIFLLQHIAFYGIGQGQEYFPAELRAHWLRAAESSKPKLHVRLHSPQTIVSLVADAHAFQGWGTAYTMNPREFYQSAFDTQKGQVIDFGEHLTGYFSCDLKTSRNTLHGPLKLNFVFAEVPAELAIPFDSYHGTLSRGWLQDEVITITELPAKIVLSRRMAFRYLRIEVLGKSTNFDFRISDMQFEALSSAANLPEPLSASASSTIIAIDRAACSTLKECMQTVYEDGPKRDRRLWIGDLYLESLANGYSFKNYALTKRCLYLLAGVSKSNGFLYPSVFESPKPHTQEGGFLFEYSLLHNVALKEYLIAIQDKKTGLDLWPVAKKQLENIIKHLGPDGLIDTDAAEKDGWWLFVDWRNGLDKQASIQGMMIFAIQESMELARILDKSKEVTYLKKLEEKLVQSSRLMYDRPSGFFLSGPSRQVSFASQCWMVLSGVASKAQGQKALKAIAGRKDAVKPGSPYLMHYYIATLIKCGLYTQAREVLSDYWGGMINKGADTFWEVYDPDNEKLSPYNFFPVNSYCHAWSCTPVYFIRKYPAIFQTSKS